MKMKITIKRWRFILIRDKYLICQPLINLFSSNLYLTIKKEDYYIESQFMSQGCELIFAISYSSTF